MYNKHTSFEYDADKAEANQKKHGYSFEAAKEVFLDPEIILVFDQKYSRSEPRWHAVGKVGTGKILTVWFTWRANRIRVIGVAEWRKWRSLYERKKQNSQPKTNENSE